MPSSISASDQVLTLTLTILCVMSWEIFWRAHYHVPDDYEDTPAVWQIQRERATGDATVLIGSSRMWQDIDLTTWQQATGVRPIQLAVAGKNPRPVLRMLADDQRFHGLVLCEVTPYLFFLAPPAAMEEFMRRGQTQTLSQRASNQLDMMLERRLAFIDYQTRLSTLWKRVPLPLRAGASPVREVPKGHLMAADRGARMWGRLEEDPRYLEEFKQDWLFYAGAPAEGPFPRLAGIVQIVAAQVAADVRKIRARGGDVVFIRFPASGPVYASESSGFPRSLAWEPFLTSTHTEGIHFEDYPQLQGYRLPEWSHMAAEDAPRFTHALACLTSRKSGLTVSYHLR
jgi:hypothetical protein